MIIGLIGFKGVGKSTAAEYLESKGYERYNFKDALVREIKENFPDLLREINKHSAPPWNETPDELMQSKPPLMRALMQNYGTDVRRKDNEDYWTGRWRVGLPAGSIVVDDVRFQNEAEAIKENSGILIRLCRPDIPTGGDHVSETEQMNIVADHAITVDEGQHARLYTELDKIIG